MDVFAHFPPLLRTSRPRLFVRHENYTLLNTVNLLDCVNPDKDSPKDAGNMPSFTN